MAHHENDLVTSKGYWFGQDRYIEAACLRRESRFGHGHSSSLRSPSVSIPHRFQEGIAVVSRFGLAVEALAAGLHRPAEAEQLDCGDPIRRLKPQRPDSTRELS